LEKVPGTLKPMLAHQQKCRTKAKITVSMQEFKYREGRDSEE
jgi:hypothetical protein